MRIEIHPKPDGMQHINLMFSEEDPGPEDLWIGAMLSDLPVSPKRMLQWERDGHQYQVFQYGQCVIGNALFYIEKHKGVVDKIRTAFRAELAAAPLTQDNLFAVVSEIARELNDEAKFTVDDRGELAIALDSEKVRSRLVERLTSAARAADTTP